MKLRKAKLTVLPSATDRRTEIEVSFHKFGFDADNEPVAIVEKDNGSIMTVFAEKIKFNSNANDFVGCTFFATFDSSNGGESRKHDRMKFVRNPIGENGFMNWVQEMRKEIEADGNACVIISCSVV